MPASQAFITAFCIIFFSFLSCLGAVEHLYSGAFSVLQWDLLGTFLEVFPLSVKPGLPELGSTATQLASTKSERVTLESSA